MDKEYLTKEVGDLEMLIGAVAREIADHYSSNDGTQAADDLLKEMQEALSELRLARGVRLMMLNAFGVRAGKRIAGDGYTQAGRRLRRAS